MTVCTAYLEHSLNRTPAWAQRPLPSLPTLCSGTLPFPWEPGLKLDPDLWGGNPT